MEAARTEGGAREEGLVHDPKMGSCTCEGPHCLEWLPKPFLLTPWRA